MKADHLEEPIDELTKEKRIEDLARQLVETEAALQALTTGQVDAILDPDSGQPLLLSEAQIELRRTHDELMQQVRERTAELAHSNLLLQALIDTIPVGALITDSVGKIISTNATARNILGSDVRGTVEAPERDYTSYFPNGTRLRPQDYPLARALKEGRSVHDVEILIRRADGDERTILVSASPIQNSSGETVSVIAVFQDITKQKQNQIRLENEQARLRTIIENVPEGIVVVDEQCRILLTNPAADKIYNRPVPFGQELESHASLSLCYPDGRPYEPHDLPLTRSAMDGVTIKGHEMLIDWPDGQRRDLLVNTAPIRKEDGEIIGAVGAFQDISDHKQSQRRLERLLRRLEILHSMDKVILTAMAIDEMLEAVLPMIRELVPCQRASTITFDWEAGEVVLLGVNAEVETQLKKGLRLPLDEGWSLNKLTQEEIRLVEDLSTLDLPPSLVENLRDEEVHSFISVPLVAQGELMGLLNLGMQDLSRLNPDYQDILLQMADQLAVGIQQNRLQDELQRHTQMLEELVERRTAALRASEARFRTVFEDSIIGIALLDMQGRFIDCNLALQEILGYSEEELRGTVITTYLHPDDIVAEEDLYQALSNGELNYYQDETRFIRKDGQVRWSGLTITRIKRTMDSKLNFAIAMMEDITEKRASQEALIQTERLTIAGRLGASLAHEINNPLQSVIGCLGLAEEILDEGVEVRRYLEIAMEELERAAGIVEQLRDLGREPEMQKKELADLNALLEKTLLLTRKRCQNYGVEVNWSPATDLPLIPLVRDRIQQVLLNILLNAVDAMPNGGQLQVSTTLTSQPEGVHIRFADNGVGIDPDKLPQIFAPFYTTQPQGLGLGLYISKNIVEEHGGTIDVESQIGEGTTFTVWLPS
jgi:PAS domain S-box-containing protein